MVTLETMTNEELIKGYLEGYEDYLPWADSTDGSAGAAWCHKVAPFVVELKNRGLYETAEQKRKEAGIGHED